MRITDLYPDVVSEDIKYEYKAELNPENPVKWVKTIVGYANGDGGILFVGVSNDGEAFGLTLDEVDKTKSLIARINDRNIFPHARIRYMLRSADDRAEKFVLAVSVIPADSVVRYREGDFHETVYIKGDGNTAPATPEEIISLSKRKFGVDNETTDVQYNEKEWTEFLSLCKEYREDLSVPTMKELQNEEIITADGYVKSGFIMFSDAYERDDTLVCCRLWNSEKKNGTVLDSERFKGSLVKVFRDSLSFIERNTKSGWRKTGKGGREEVRSYPRAAVREALVNALAHRDYSIAGTQIDVDIYKDRIDIVSPGSWLLPKKYEEYPVGVIPSVRRNTIIAASLDVANLMERGGTGFQAMIDSYVGCTDDKQPVVMIYPGFLDIRLFDRLYEEEIVQSDIELQSDSDIIIKLLKTEGPKPIKELQAVVGYKSRSRFLKEVIDPLIDKNIIYRDGNIKSPTALIKLK